jgi:hypothetical protein
MSSGILLAGYFHVQSSANGWHHQEDPKGTAKTKTRTSVLLEMREIFFHSSNGHIVKPWGRLFYLVTSYSRDELLHLVDLEPDTEDTPLCSCESQVFHGLFCRHVRATCEFLLSNIDLNEHEFEEAISRLEITLRAHQPIYDTLAVIGVEAELRHRLQEPLRKKRAYTLKKRSLETQR